MLTRKVFPSGWNPRGPSPYFRYRTPDGRQKDAFLGRYPDFSLAEARRMLDEMRAKLARGIDPSIERKMARAGGRFQGYCRAVAR